MLNKNDLQAIPSNKAYSIAQLTKLLFIGDSKLHAWIRSGLSVIDELQRKGEEIEMEFSTAILINKKDGEL